MIRIKLLLSVVALAFVTSVAAENSKIFVGADVAIVKYTGSEYDYDPVVIAGFSAGYLRTFTIGESGLGVDVGAGIQYVTGTTESYDSYSGVYGGDYENDFKRTFCNLNIPVVIAYRIGSSDSFAFRPYAGVNLRLGLLVKTEVSYSDDLGVEDSIIINYYDKDDMAMLGSDYTARRFKAGMIFGGDFEFPTWSVGYQWGGDFGDIIKDDEERYSWHTLRFAYKF
ncbi:MAG: outer membrane beta-barrel protein [Rikenellaceae bacterium]